MRFPRRRKAVDTPGARHELPYLSISTEQTQIEGADMQKRQASRIVIAKERCA